MPAERFDFPNAASQKLAALLDRPDGSVRAAALFAHCFTCGKSTARHIAEGLKLHGIAVLRFDFTGLGARQVLTVYSCRVWQACRGAGRIPSVSPGMGLARILPSAWDCAPCVCGVGVWDGAQITG